MAKVRKSTASKRRYDDSRKPGEARGTREFNPSPVKRGCKRCGSRDVTWQVSSSGNWYLTEIFEDAEGRSYTEHALFHSEFCGSPEKHDDEQAIRLEAETSDRKQTKAISKAREEKNNQEEAEYFLALHDLCKSNRPEALDQLGEKERELEREMAQPVSMDYMTEHMRYAARVKRLKAEIAFMQAALGMTKYEED